MPKTTRRVLKASEVAFDDPLPLGIDPAPGPCGTDSQAATTGPSVRIAQNGPDYAVIEVKCTCGKMTYIRCEYATVEK